jgi:signal transduction histidine kinase
MALPFQIRVTYDMFGPSQLAPFGKGTMSRRRRRILRIIGFEPMSHRPELPARYWLYAAVAYLIPVVAQIVFPQDPALTDELVWLITLAPAFLLSLHYGLRGAFAALLMGTALFVVVQLVVALNFTPDDWRITVPTFVAYGVLAISVGWLSEELHEHYQSAIEQERMATIGQMALTIKHSLNNALTAVVTECQFLASDSDDLTEDQRESLRSLNEAALRMAREVDKITTLNGVPRTTEKVGFAMLDLEN